MCGHVTCVVVFLNVFIISGKLIVHAHDDVNRYTEVYVIKMIQCLNTNHLSIGGRGRGEGLICVTCVVTSACVVT